ncbi:uracil-DNA glycosylase [Candidatus Woesearchaeota archaeon]|jgi:uracil-DNA glycosylase|nr:uracil-DNA glycosylase [Candidatus Woesearchaeota archaeon]MBT3538052.1 uracil-DNA glycosylase [Candidatus Woesearchaeota archaeon]MBT4697136.1 uracil-DNA glycosylase [Candidatus Woesearchaeota archaeon]MBT4717127.1 uracil-DNA glycosylase [Candidatus Woesearchaeota archaeon]MBT7105721.1 uracil-DNA glycosylase [Candidatus Woesearchaeota archaeon]
MIEEAKTCTNCELSKTRTNVVIGKGREDAEILLIGEAPGRNEDEQGLPFVGAAGKNLDKFLSVIGLSSEDVYIANILKCRPPENRDPKPDEIKICTPWLIKQIEHIKPRVICTLGNYSTKFILSKCDPDHMKSIGGISALHGKVVTVVINQTEYKVIPLYHPAALIYNRSLQSQMDEDLITVKKTVEKYTGTPLAKQKSLSEF